MTEDNNLRSILDSSLGIRSTDAMKSAGISNLLKSSLLDRTSPDRGLMQCSMARPWISLLPYLKSVSQIQKQENITHQHIHRGTIDLRVLVSKTFSYVVLRKIIAEEVLKFILWMHK